MVEPRCTCGHPSTNHELHPSLVIGPCSAVLLTNTACPCTAYTPLAQPPMQPTGDGQGLKWR
jgi:hypothetical protein